MFVSDQLKMAAAALAVVASVAMCVQKHDAGTRLPGAPVAGEPEQDDRTRRAAFEHRGYRIAPVAQFTVRARLLSAERYSLGRQAELSPIDFALGWNGMSDDRVLARLRISQGNRFYYYGWDDAPPLPMEEMVRSSANMHLIPATADVRRRLESVRPGSTVTLYGWLVDVSAPDGWSWRTSRTRTDSGNGACELVWVEDVEVGGDT
jgi:hypothetical protein